MKKYNNDIYKMYEEQCNKCIKLDEELKKIKRDYKICNYDLKNMQKSFTNKLQKQIEKLVKPYIEENNLLKKQINEMFNEINRLKEELNKIKTDDSKDYVIDKLTNQINKDSTNSSIPTSKESIKNNIKRRTNTYNHRTESKNKTGGQYNHTGKTLTKESIEKKINDYNLQVEEIKHYISDKKYSKEIIKYQVGIKVKTYIEKHIFIPSNNKEDILPKKFYSDVTYKNDLKSIVLVLGNYCSLAYNKITELLSDLTGEIIQLSEGTIDNIYEEFSEKSQETILNITNNIINGTFQHTDETATKENGKDSFYRGYANKQNVLYKYHNHKGDEPIKEDGILTNFFGTVISDHDKGMFKYGTNNQDCVIHFGRYCKEQEQNIPNTSWQNDMYNLLLRYERNRRILIKYGATSFSNSEIDYMNKEYDNMLKIAEIQNKDIFSTYWREKAESLLKRCIKYKNQILLYIHDFTIDYDNNFIERALRMIKNKTKVSGGFRSHNGGERFGNIMSIIKTSKLRNLNPFQSINNIMSGKNLFA